MSDELFAPEAVTAISPRLAWINKYGIFLHSPDASLVGKEDDHGDTIHAYYATSRDVGPSEKEKVGVGATADEALADFAIKHGLKLWNEVGS